MALNLDALKSRLNELQKNGKKSNYMFKPTDKEQRIRIVPYKYKPDNPFIELYFHYDLNGNNYLSPISFGKPDPIAEVANKLKSAGDIESWKQGKQLYPKLRTYVPVIVRGKEDEGVKFWGFGKTIYEDLLSYIASGEYGDITDPAVGRDITVYSVKESGKQFATPKIRISPNQTPISEDRNIINLIANDQPDITEIYELKSYEELEKIMNDYFYPESDESNSEESQPPTPTKENKSSNPTQDIGDIFKNVFEQNQ